jgi:arginyl-tRNA synthetase
MNATKEAWREIIARAIREETGEELEAARIILEIPPRPDLGDLAFPMFPYARIFRKSPQKIAEILAARISAGSGPQKGGRLVTAGPYLNVHLDPAELTAGILAEVRGQAERFGLHTFLAGQSIVVEFSCPNTNKPLHLGHLRNDALGMSVARLLEAGGAEVRRVNLINDRGIHICKSMLAYQKFGNNATPESEQVKSDHFVGDYYVRFNDWASRDESAEEAARAMLQGWEAGDPELRELWRTMNRWAIEGIEETYAKTGVSFDQVYFESETYLLGRDQVLQGLEQNLFYRGDDGTIWVDLSDIDLDKKVLLRSDGTSLYLTQDIGTAVQRHHDWPFDRMIYVVASEQRYHFAVLFKVLELLGYRWSENLHHLAYGMVNLPEGKMKSREGTVVDADDLLSELKKLAVREIQDKGREEEIDDLEGTAEKVTLAALNYYLLQVSPTKDMVFNPAESISFTGNTGPYLQYTGARISSMLRKFTERRQLYSGGRARAELLAEPVEWRLVKQIAVFPEAVAQAARELNPALVAAYLFELAKSYNGYYHDHPVLQNEDKDLVVTRIELARAVAQVLKNGCALIGVPFLEAM